MTQVPHTRRWGKLALSVGVAVVAAIAAAVVIGAWLRPEGRPPIPLVTQGASTPSMVRVSATAVQQPVLKTEATPVAAPAMPADDTDLSRLRSRSLDVPVSGISAAQLNDNYTQARAGGAEHEALDIMAPRGTPVLAVEDGRIAKLFLSKPGGITLYHFDPSGEYAYYYAHLDSYADGIVEGGKLRKGQVIGYVGSTGNASPDAPHLHFAIYKLGVEKQWWRGTPINPFLIWREAKP